MSYELGLTIGGIVTTALSIFISSAAAYAILAKKFRKEVVLIAKQTTESVKKEFDDKLKIIRLERDAEIKTLKGEVDAVVAKVIEKSKSMDAQSEAKLLALAEQLTNYTETSVDSDKSLREALVSLIKDRISEAHMTHISTGAIGRHTINTLEELYKYLMVFTNGEPGYTLTEMEELRKLEAANS